MLWGGRFASKVDDIMWEFNRSIDFDKYVSRRLSGFGGAGLLTLGAVCRELFPVDVAGSIAYANALRKVGILSEVGNGVRAAERDVRWMCVEKA